MSPPKLAPRTEKRCPDCGEVRPLESFHRNRSSADGRQGYCKKCWPARNANGNRKRSGRGYHRDSHLQRNYGIGVAEYEAMLALSDGTCWACGEPESATHPDTGTVFFLSVDHDHATGVVRGLLCFKCNTTIRSVGDDRQRLLDLVRYLTEGRPNGQ